MKKHNFLRPSAYGIGIVGVVYRSCGTVVLCVFGVIRSQSANLTRYLYCVCTLQINCKANWLITSIILYKNPNPNPNQFIARPRGYKQCIYNNSFNEIVN